MIARPTTRPFAFLDDPAMADARAMRSRAVSGLVVAVLRALHPRRHLPSGPRPVLVRRPS